MNFLKSFKKKHLIYATALVAIFAFILLFPTEASAETIQQTLRDNDQIKELHRGLLNIVNIPVILLIIVIAFSEMLRLKIDTYGFKKILPTLILAIVAAQFSYLFCKLIIDAANMTITLFTDPNLLSKTFGEASTLPSKYSKTFEALFPTPPDWVNFTYGMFFEILLKVLFLFVGSILLLVLCFLFLIRGWMIYFLVIVSPVAFMALSLPQTKSYFNKWWSEFIKWTFMPVPSIFFLWLGVTVLGHPIITSSWLPIPIMSVIIAAICLYAAIKVPFKLGGVAMDKFWNYSGAKWGLGKAKDKWFDPWLDDAKRRVGNWYQSQGNKHNLLGWNVRRGQEVTARRAWRKKEEEGYKNQNFREAFGGKFGKDGDEFMSVEKQAKYGEWLDNIDSLFGETEWKDLDLREKYFRTEKGQQAALRSAQYGLRMEGTQQLIDNVKRTARIKAFARDDEYIKDDHYKRMLDVRNKAKAENFALEMEERKIEGDMYQTVEGEAYLLDMAVEAYDVWTDKLKKKQEELAKATTEAQKRVIQAEIKAIEEEQRKAEVSYQETAKKLLSNDKYFKKDTREFDGLSYMFRDILTDENGKLQGVELDSQGNFISADVTKARRLAEVMGFKPGTTSYGYYNGRRTKRYGIIVKEEVASVQGKRTGEDSIFEIVNTPFEWEAIAKIITGLTGGLTEKQIRKTSAEVANIFKGLSINNAQWTPRHLWLTNEVEAKF